MLIERTNIKSSKDEKELRQFKKKIKKKRQNRVSGTWYIAGRVGNRRDCSPGIDIPFKHSNK